jgi:hypothetical protein
MVETKSEEAKSGLKDLVEAQTEQSHGTVLFKFC